MRDCFICGSEANYDLLCKRCGQFFCQEELSNLLSEENQKILREKYEIVYKALNDKYKELKNIQCETRLPEGRVELIKRLPKPKNANVIDIICIADSISCSYLESFYQIVIENQGIVLGEYVRKEILCWPKQDLKKIANLSLYAKIFSN